ncbi:hypothetical protein D9758_007575 [Tetrapyrgos nigripes]|uniref:Uncharacterized protein n=1 Tax=Tetrapyrgos nigripes TaxID=182062 RepID=A0A8H5LK72_9AGAR|nr:hypothetical protein D9758_007575 [Tetrapyrgos nigripes]
MLPPDSPIFPSERSARFLQSVLTRRHYRTLLGLLVLFSTVYLLRKIDTPIRTVTLDQLSLSRIPIFDPSYPKYSKTPLKNQEHPPLYEQWHKYERNLPQHVSLPPPEGKAAKFLFMADHAYASGWGNILQEMILNAHLAYATNRAFVFDNYTWDRHESDYSEFNGKIIPSRVPVSTMLSGPIIGGPLLTSSSSSELHPRAVHREYYRSLCPDPTIIHPGSIKSDITSNDGLEVMTRWVNKIKRIEKEMEDRYGEDSMEARCLELAINEGQLFDICLLNNLWRLSLTSVFGHSNILSLWPVLRQSPIIQQFAFSPLILRAYHTNKELFLPSSQDIGFFSWLTSFLPFPSFSDSRTELALAKLGDHPVVLNASPIPGLLTIHLRRGDFLEHCQNLVQWNSEYSGFNAAKEFYEDDKLKVPSHQGSEMKANLKELGKEEKEREYRRHCFPTIEEIVDKVERVRKDVREYVVMKRLQEGNSAIAGAGEKGHVEVEGEVEMEGNLNRIYIMSNAPKEWLEELKDALMWNGGHGRGWEDIRTSRDLELSWEEKYVAQSLDMYVAMRSEAFIGNGFSSLTSNIVMIRMARNVNPVYTRLW